MRADTVLALDLATRTGFAVGRWGEVPRWGAWPLGGQDASGSGRRFSRLADYLTAAIEAHEPRLIVYEAPAGRRGGATARLLASYCAIVEVVAFDNKVAYREEHVGTVRKAVLGRGNWKARNEDEAKRPIFDWCRAQGWDVQSSDAADALVLLRHAQIILRSRVMAGYGSVAA